MLLTVASWNVNSIKMRLTHLQGFLERVRPDIVCLQEIKCSDGDFPSAPLHEQGYKAFVSGQKAYNGVAVLVHAQHPLATAPDVPSATPLQLCADVAESRLLCLHLGPVDIYSVYAPNGGELGSPKYQHKLRWYDALRTHLAASTRPSILAGDFNIAPDDRDVYDPAAWQGQTLCSFPERARWEELLTLGYRDTFRLHHAEGGHYSWWDYRQMSFSLGRGLRIDCVLASAQLASCCQQAWIDSTERNLEKPSDHTPVLARFALPAG